MPAVARNVGPALDPHPRLGDHAEDPLAADHHPVGARPGAGAGQPAALPPALRREHAHRLDEVVDVGVVGGVVPAGTGGDPAAERREAEALREVAQREPVRVAAGPRARGRRCPPGCGPPARSDRSRAPGRSGPSPPSRRRRLRAGSRPTPPTTRRRTGPPWSPLDEHQSSTACELVSERGWATASVGFGKREVEGVGAVGEVGAVGVERPLPGLGGAAPRRARPAPSTRDGRSSASARSGTGRGVIDDAEALRQVLGASGPGQRRSAPPTPRPRPRTIDAATRPPRYVGLGSQPSCSPLLPSSPPPLRSGARPPRSAAVIR